MRTYLDKKEQLRSRVKIMYCSKNNIFNVYTTFKNFLSLYLKFNFNESIKISKYKIFTGI